MPKSASSGYRGNDARFRDERAYEALLNWRATTGADFTDALLSARAWSLGTERFVTFDKRAARLAHAQLLQ
jgi:predicted nucleic-acid-binding protein